MCGLPAKCLDDKIKRYIFSYIDANMYILAENGEALVIDPHISAEADAYLKSNRVTKVTILLTHEHFDHTCGIPGSGNTMTRGLFVRKKQWMPGGRNIFAGRW